MERTLGKPGFLDGPPAFLLWPDDVNEPRRLKRWRPLVWRRAPGRRDVSGLIAPSTRS